MRRKNTCSTSTNISPLPQTVLCVGDLMLDEFVYGEVSRISPEAPTPVIAVKRSGTDDRRRRQRRAQPGRARHTLHLRRRGRRRRCRPGALPSALDGEPLIEFKLVVDAARQTTRKVRFVSEHFSTHLLRADWEMAVPIDAASEDALIAPRGRGDAAGRRGGAVRLRQGRAHAARHPRRDRCRQRRRASRWWSIPRAATIASTAAPR